MNIEHDEQTYEVLSLDRISEITHAKLAGGKVVTAETNGTDVWLWSPTMEHADATCFDLTELEPYGIQPLRLVQREPVTFEATFALSGSSWYPLHHLSDGLAHQNSTTKRFRCVEIVEEAK